MNDVPCFAETQTEVESYYSRDVVMGKFTHSGGQGLTRSSLAGGSCMGRVVTAATYHPADVLSPVISILGALETEHSRSIFICLGIMPALGLHQNLSNVAACKLLC